VAAQHHDDCPLVSGGVGDGADYLQEIARNEYIGERFEEGCEAAILARWRCKFASSDFVRPPLNRNRPDLGEIYFLGRAAPAAGAAGLSLTA
jgi:hypothetical protein